MVLGSLFTQPSLSLTLSEDMVFVHPSQFEPDLLLPSTGRDPLIFGTALLSLPSAKAVNKIRVVFEGLCDASGGSGQPYESSTTLHKELEIDLKGEIIEAGDHAFNFSFIVPSNTAPYQRCNYGRTRHSVKATASFAGAFTPSVSSPPIAVYVVASPQAAGEVPLPADISIQHFSEDLGPVGIGFASPHLTVASLVNVRVTMLGAPSPVQILSIDSFVTQQYEIQYTNGKVHHPKAKRYILRKISSTDSTPSPSLCVPICTGSCNGGQPTSQELPLAPASSPSSTDCCPPRPDLPSCDSNPLAALDAEQGFHYSRTMRVPTDDHVRPTTLEGTKARIRVSHKLSVEVRYRLAGAEQDKILFIGKDMVIGSCCALADSLLLPSYSACAPKTIQRPLHMRCYCSTSLKEMVDRDGLALQRAGEIQEPNSFRLLGADAGSKSPGFTDTGTPTLRGSPRYEMEELEEY
ncbi:hypothetical protein BCR35DRAFT_286729 [Leucosporidium creatinivorum]|uniref:Arrestin-like N-terminal domain-containing protein n=1 Tax=Leucosporidium creatinivorum TaxID=106004 RepID=A0A1Y2G2Y8_9BASI|nr:hypothetical protein BCR35DRAFT_286729 [Leucosporidium creatinivorum]